MAVMANDHSKLPKHNNYENSHLNAGFDLYLTLGHKVIFYFYLFINYTLSLEYIDNQK